jgi:hypothetical protein
MRSFDVLSDLEFEEVVADILAAELNRPVERFARGQDDGVDLRWKADEGLSGSRNANTTPARLSLTCLPPRRRRRSTLVRWRAPTIDS